MKTEIDIHTHLDGLRLGFFDGDEFIHIDDLTRREVAKKFGCDESFLETLGVFVDCLKDYVGQDLREIWKRLDDIEERSKALVLPGG